MDRYKYIGDEQNTSMRSTIEGLSISDEANEIDADGFSAHGQGQSMFRRVYPAQ